MPRPCVAAIRSLSRGWISRSWNATVGMFSFRLRHGLPASSETKTPNSVPTNSRLRVLRVLADDVDGLAVGNASGEVVQVLP